MLTVHFVHFFDMFTDRVQTENMNNWLRALESNQAHPVNSRWYSP